MDLYSIGEMVIDFLPGSEADSYIRKAGGAPANVAIAMEKNGLQVGMCCSVGDDDFGHFLYDTLKENNVRILNDSFCEEAITTMAFVTLAPDGDRSFTFARKPGADMFLSETAVREDDIQESSIVHAGSCSLSASPVAEATEKALRLGFEMNKLVSFDLNYRNLMWNDDKEACAEKVMECMKYIDLLKVSEEEIDMIGGEDNLFQMMSDNNVSLIVETLGGDGAKCFFASEVFRVQGKKVKCVDATGAGDAFWGGFLSSLCIQGITKASDLTKEIIEKAMNYGNAAGAICVQTKGAISSLPTREQIESTL